ncbi:MAG: B12-binding domain-containing radical SAM protein [Candidatus Helarchaeota archaeon]
MRVLLINPATREYGDGLFVQAQAPLGLLSLASVLREAGHEVRIFDHNIESKATQKYLKFNPELIGFTAFTGPMIRDGLRLAELFKQHLDAPIIWGGVHASLLPLQTVQDPRVDMCVVGEGEETIVELAEAIERNKDLGEVRGLVWKKNKNGTSKIVRNPPRPFISDLNSLPLPAWDLIDPKHYQATSLGIIKSSTSIFSIQSSRGCPYQCRFCYNTIFNKRMWRCKSAERVLEEIAYLKELFRVRHLNFRDDNFVINKKRVAQICKGLHKENLDVNFAIDCRVDLLTHQLTKHLKLGGCDQIFFGIESGTPRILEFIKKGITLSQAMNAIKRCKQYGIWSSGSFIIGFPTETLEEVLQTKKFIFKLRPDSILFKIFVPYPGSFLYDYVVKEGLFTPPQRLQDWGFSWSNVSYKLSQVPPYLLNQIIRKTMASYFIKTLFNRSRKFLKAFFQGDVRISRLLQTAIANRSLLKN